MASNLAAGLPIQPPQPTYHRAIVKQVNSGDTVVLRGPPRGGPPPERVLSLSNITAPRLARRQPQGKPEDAKDEPWAFEAREFLRKKLVGKEILFTVEHKIPSGKEYGTIYLGKDIETAENVSECIVAEGLVSVRKEGKDNTRLLELEEAARASQRGKWGTENEKHIRDVTWQVENVRNLLDKLARKPVDGVVEHVRDGSTIRVLLLPAYNYITLMMSGIRSPGFKLGLDGQPDPLATEKFAEEAKFFTESRILQQNVQVILESVNNQNFVGSVLHPNGNIAELLLRDGMARCIDWSMGFVTGGAEKLRAAEKFAKERRLRIWKDYQENQTSSLSGLKAKDREFTGIVMECVNADSLVVKTDDGTLKKIFLASIRPPRLAEDKDKEKGEGDAKTKGFRPLYDIPYMFEAREYLRKKLIGKKAHITVDYVQAATQSFPEKICCTVKADGINIGEALITKGLGTVVRYRQDDDQRASDYDVLLAAEAKAQKSFKGIYGKKDVPMLMHHVVDITGDSVKAKQFLPFFKRAGKTNGLVEFVASGSRLRVFVPKEMRIITFILAGISCPRADRFDPKTKETIPGEAFGNEARAFTKELCLQREVEIEVEDIDKAGNFIGWLWFENKNLSQALVEEGLASVHFSADKTIHARALRIAEDNAKARRDNIWHDYVEVKEDVKAEEEKQDRKVVYRNCFVTEVTPELHVFVQFTDDGDKLENLANDFRRELAENPPISGAFTPRKDMVCVAKYSADGQWYRAKVERELPNRTVQVLFIDYGNRETIPFGKCAPLPNVPGSSTQGFAREYSLACVTLPPDEEDVATALSALKEDTQDCKLKLNVEYKVGNTEYITLLNESTGADIGEALVRDGFLLVDNRKEKRLQKLMKEYRNAEREAKTHHRGVWQYGDITQDDAREFGMAR